MYPGELQKDTSDAVQTVMRSRVDVLILHGQPGGLLGHTSMSSMSSAGMMAGCLSGRSASAAISSARVSVTTCRKTNHDWGIALMDLGSLEPFEDMGTSAEHSSHVFSSLHRRAQGILMQNAVCRLQRHH